MKCKPRALQRADDNHRRQHVFHCQVGVNVGIKQGSYQLSSWSSWVLGVQCHRRKRRAKREREEPQPHLYNTNDRDRPLQKCSLKTRLARGQVIWLIKLTARAGSRRRGCRHGGRSLVLICFVGAGWNMGWKMGWKMGWVPLMMMITELKMRSRCQDIKTSRFILCIKSNQIRQNHTQV